MAERSADLRVLIAVRPVEEGKSRLASSLSDGERTALNQRLFDHVCGVCLSFVPAGRIFLVSRSRALLGQGRAWGMQAVAETGSGLNAALAQGAAAVAGAADGPLLTLATDLPGLTRDDLIAMENALRSAQVVIAPDHTGQGTNALAMARPGLVPFHYGAGSLAAHVAAARRAGLAHALVERPGLARDLDTPEDLAGVRWAPMAGAPPS